MPGVRRALGLDDDVRCSSPLRATGNHARRPPSPCRNRVSSLGMDSLNRHILQSSADELLGRKPPPKLAAVRQPPEEKRLWRHLRVVASLPERDQRAVLRIIDSTAKARRGA